MAIRSRNILSLCAGVGGLEIGIQLALQCRGETGRGICHVEIEAAAAASLVASMEAGWFHPAPVWSDMLTFDARPWRGLVHILASGDPCQENSVAGKRAGAAGKRFLAPEVVRIADECRPDLIFRENVPGNAGEQLDALVPALERLGYRVAAGIFSSAETGNTMRRERLFIMAERDGSIDARRVPGSGESSGGRARCQSGGCGGKLVNAESVRRNDRGPKSARRAQKPIGGSGCDVDRAERVGFHEGRDDNASHERDVVGAAGQFDLGWASSAELQGQQPGQHDPAGRQVKGRHPLVSGRAVFPPTVIPGPSDNRGWIDVLDRWPELQPALSQEEAESHLRRGIDALANRIERLRATGNGVDPVAACSAFLSLSALLDEQRAGAAEPAVRWG